MAEQLTQVRSARPGVSMAYSHVGVRAEMGKSSVWRACLSSVGNCCSFSLEAFISGPECPGDQSLPPHGWLHPREGGASTCSSGCASCEESCCMSNVAFKRASFEGSPAFSDP